MYCTGIEIGCDFSARQNDKLGVFPNKKGPNNDKLII